MNTTHPGGYVTVKKGEFGETCYLDEHGRFHREDEPAITQPDGPAVVYPDGGKEWWLNGERHRKDGPAVVYPDGCKEWWLNGERHRKDGPAVVYPDGSERWFLNGELHREDGPAVVHHDGSGIYYLWGQRYGDVDDFHLRILDFEESLPDETVARAMKEHGLNTVQELANWVMLEVLGEQAHEVLSEGNGENLHYAMVEYLNNYEKYEGLPFSWWFPITSPGIGE